MIVLCAILHGVAQFESALAVDLSMGVWYTFCIGLNGKANGRVDVMIRGVEHAKEEEPLVDSRCCGVFRDCGILVDRKSRSGLSRICPAGGHFLKWGRHGGFK